MGYAYYQLVPAAIMYDNPGCTKEELSELFLQTNAYLGERPVYRLIDQSWRQELREVREDSVTSEDGFLFDKNPYRDRTQKEKINFIRKENFARWDNSSSKLFGEGDSANNFHTGLYGVAKLLRIKEKIEGIIYIQFKYKPDFLKERNVRAEYDDFEGLTTFFPDIDSLEKHHSFKPEKVFHFDQKEGSFGDLYRANHIYRWSCKNGKYYFDFERMRDNVDVQGFSDSMNKYCEPCTYTDFIVTLEAVRKKAWKILSYRGLQHIDNFFKKYPDSREVYEKALRDSFFSIYCKSKGESNFDMMRLRLENRIVPNYWTSKT